MLNSIPHASTSEYTYQNGIKCLQSFKLSSFIVPQDIMSILVDQNFTISNWSGTKSL